MRFKRVLKQTRKLLVTTGMTLLLFSAIAQPTMTAYAAEAHNNVAVTQQMTQQATQSPRWEGQGDEWRVKDGQGGYLRNTWYQDEVTGHWYMLGAGDGTLMYSGLVTDQSTGRSYLLHTLHDGTYGRMVDTDGVYTINGKQVYLTFDQNHTGTYGAITSGLSELRSTGINESRFSAIPVTTNSVAETQQQQQQQQAQTQTQQVQAQTSITTEANNGHWYDKYMKADGTMDFSKMTRAEQEAYIEEIEGVTVGHLGGLDIEAAQEAANRLNRQ